MANTSTHEDLDRNGWRGRIGNVARIGPRAGFGMVVVLALFCALVVFGISTSGHRRSAVTQQPPLTKANEPNGHQPAWWEHISNMQVQRPPLATITMRPAPETHIASGNVTPTVPAIRPLAPDDSAAHNAEQERATRALAAQEAAQDAAVTVQLGNSSERAPISPSSSSIPQVPAIGATPTSQNPDSRQAFLHNASGSAPPDQTLATLIHDVSPYELHAGSVIPATLITGINAQLPGTIVAQVREDVLDSATGRFVLIPRGTKVVGTYDSQVVQGQQRVLVVWTRLLFQNETSLDIPAQSGTDPEGYAGLSASVNDHLSKAITSALLLSIISAGAQLSQPQQSTGLAAPNIGQTLAASLGQQIGNESVQLTQRQLQLPPTLVVPPGYLFDVLVDRDIVLSQPYEESP